MALIRLRVCAGWSEPLLVAHTTLLEIPCCGSYVNALIAKAQKAEDGGECNASGCTPYEYRQLRKYASAC